MDNLPKWSVMRASLPGFYRTYISLLFALWRTQRRGRAPSLNLWGALIGSSRTTLATTNAKFTDLLRRALECFDNKNI